jgi:Tol biopolymer transport system component
MARVPLVLTGGRTLLLILGAVLATGCTTYVDHTRPAERAHLSNMRQLTFGGTNAEAYWSFDDDELILQITNKHLGSGTETRGVAKCDQIFRLDVDSGELTGITDAGRTTCAFFTPDGDRVVFASTHESGLDCPPKADKSQGYVWDVYDSYDVFSADPDGGNLVNLTATPGYDAEATISRDGRLVFTSLRSGDLELWTMDLDGGNLHQVTDRPGYDGGAFFNNAGTQIVWRSTRFDSPQELDEYWELIANRLVKPAKLELWIADADGSNMRQLTDNSQANFAPFFTPDDQSIVFASNLGGGFFDLWMMDLATGELEQITHTPGFESFPMFSWDGERIAFTSGRSAAQRGDLNVFVADWTP